MGVTRKADCSGIGQVQFVRHMALGFFPYWSKHTVPFPSRQGARVMPGGYLCFQRHVRPQMVAMCHKRYARRLRGKRAGKQVLPVAGRGHGLDPGLVRVRGVNTFAGWVGKPVSNRRGQGKE